MDLKEIFEKQGKKAILLRHETISHRLARLSDIVRWIQSNRVLIQQALAEDLHKPSQEADITEIFPLLSEIRKARKNLKHWARPVNYPSSLTFLGTSGSLHYEPKGVCLIISPWNYPLLLTLGPLVSALAAGNTIFLKPSEYTPSTSALISKMTNELFDESIVKTVEGDYKVSQELLGMPFNHVFFTGSPEVGKVVMKAAASHLASVTLELGGKSPTIVDETADISDATMKIAWGKWVNAGQTCVAPDYVFVHSKVKDDFLAGLTEKAKFLYSEKANYTSIVNERHFERLSAMMNDSNLNDSSLYLSGKVNKSNLTIEPTIYTDVSEEALIMKEEIFGPLLPVIVYDNLEAVINEINSREKPLALYHFSRSRKIQKKIVEQTSSGTVVINDCVLQFAHPSLPFGGVNNSGFGKSHGKFGFQAFSNEKSVLKQRRGQTMAKLLYPPYNSWKNKLIDTLIKYF
ncbi:MAG: aldehyde dehydrogenase family protein [Cyclobacteriaceae bacterium]